MKSLAAALVATGLHQLRIMKLLLVCFTLLFSVLSLGADLKEWILTPGQFVTFPHKSISLWVSDPKILQVDRLVRGWKMTASQVGSTRLKLDSNSYEIHVLSPPEYDLYQALKKWTSKKIGPALRIEKGQVQITDSVYRLQDWIEISDLSEMHQAQFVFKATLSSDLKKEAENYFEKNLTRSGLMPVKIFFNPSPLVYFSPKDSLLKSYKDFFSRYGVQIVYSDQALQIEPVVKIEMTILEVQKNKREKFGFQWPTEASAQIHPQWGWDELNLKLHALTQEGQAKILASPNVICRNGKEAQFFVGGEFPISVRKVHTNEVIWKNYGIMMKFNPLADSSGRMSLGLQSEISYLDPALKVEEIPALKTQRLSTHFDLSKSQVVVLSGLLKEQSGFSKEGISLLSQIPILGNLFSSHDYQNDRSELLILVKPSLVDLNQ